MLKKTLSLLLCIATVISCFGAVAVTGLAGDVDAKSLFTVKSEPVSDNMLTYTVSVNAQQKGIAGIVVYVEYDSSVLQPINCGPAATVNSDGTETQIFDGIFTYGNVKNSDGLYSIAYMNDVSYSTGSTSSEFFRMQFEVIDSTHPKTDVNFYCKEYYSVSEPDKNITVEDGLKEILLDQNVSTLEMPEMVSVTGSTDGLSVRWNPVDGAIGYVVYRKTTVTDWVNVGLASGANACEYTDSDLESGTTYIYSVAAANDYGESSKDSIGISCEYIAKPVVISLKNAVGGIEISWTQTEGAKSYNVMRRVEGETEWTLISNRAYSSGVTFKDTNGLVDGKQYEYDVNSVTSTYVSATLETGAFITYVASPGVTVSNAADGIKLQWISNSAALKYEIYRKVVGQESALSYYAETTGNTFYDEDVAAGVSYSYAVKIITADGESAYNANGYTTTYVPPTEVTSLALERYGVNIQWESVDNAVGYYVYRRTANTSIWVKIASLVATVTCFSDTSVNSGGAYVYAVCPIINGVESVKSESESIYVLKAPADVSAENIDEGIEVTWEKVTGAETYVIYRSENGGAYTEVSRETTLCFEDTEVIFGNRYTYIIKCLNSKGESLESEVSDELIRIGAIGKTSPVIAEGGILVNWDAVEGVDYYAVYRNQGNGFVSVATVDEPCYLDNRVNSNVRYYYSVAAIIDGSRGILNTESPVGLLYVAPASGISVANNSVSAVVSWNAVDGAMGYEVYRSLNSEDEPVLVGTTTSDILKYTDSDVVAGTEYYYYVRTLSTEENSMLSVGKRNVFLAVPQIYSISNAYGGVTFKWNSVDNATGYRVYRKVYGDANWVCVATVESDVLTYTDTTAVNGKYMCYTIRAVNEDSVSGFVVKGGNYLAAPQITMNNSPSGVYLTWEKNPLAINYWVYRKVPGAKSWTRIAIVSTNYYTDKNVESGGGYIYTIRAYTGKIISGYNPSGWTIRHLATPVLKQAGLGYGAITCFWNPVAGAEGYYVYRIVDDNGTWSYIGKTSETMFRDTNVVNGSKYTYTVRAYYGTTRSSFNYSGVSTNFLEAPTLKVTNNISGVYLSWNKVSGAKGYYLYRKVAGAKNWTRIATVTKNYYVDTEVSSGKQYIYTIKAYDSNKMSGYNSYGWKTYYLAAPKLISVASYPSGVLVKWEKVTGATWYSIYRKGTTGTWTRIGTTTGNGAVTFIDETAELDKKYTYTVRACYGSNISSYYSGLSCRVNY